jgi:uncharacterized RDD family membrane protein YckC
MNRKYFLDAPIRTAKFSRLIAKVIDLFIVFILSVFFYPLGIIMAMGYLGVSDAMSTGQSVGKKFMGFRVVSLEDGSPCNLKQSLIRNLPLLVPLFLAIIPIWGWIFSFLTGIPLIFLEVYLIYKLDSGHRLGDVMADTTVMAHDMDFMTTKKKRNSWFESKVQQGP